nr:hypothetical protein [Nonomuraea basaltis]
MAFRDREGLRTVSLKVERLTHRPTGREFPHPYGVVVTTADHNRATVQN